jgi:FAD/FMN-containing dehydrogenase
VTTNLAKPEDNNSGEDDPQAVNALREAFNATHWIPAIGSRLYSKLLDLSMSGSANVIRTGKSYEVFPHVRIVRFREMEYTVPAEVGPACMQEIMQTIRTKKLPISFPFEYRYVKGDDVWLSMFEGRDGCSISIHQYGDLDYKRVFAEIEPIFWKYEGRPHWGKIHTLDAQRLASLYPRHWQDFQEIRTALDPEGKMMNKHLKQIFGDR